MESATTLPPSCALALKEWASVLVAMERGEQLVFLRKGGLIESGTGFSLRAPTFVCYPTFEHQTVNYVRPSYQGHFDEALRRRAPDGSVRFELVGCAVQSLAFSDPTLIGRLSNFHIYNDAFVSQRLKWQPDQPMALVIIRAYRLPAPRVVPVSPSYAGCTSWVDLESPVLLDGAQPVLDDATFQQRLRALQLLLPS